MIYGIKMFNWTKNRHPVIIYLFICVLLASYYMYRTYKCFCKLCLHRTVCTYMCCIVEHRFPHFTHQIGYHPTFSDVFYGFSRLSPLFARSPHIFVVSATIFSLTLRSSSKSWRLPQKCSVNGEKKRNPWKTVKNCRKMSGGTRLVRKMRKAMLNNPTRSKSVFIFNF